MDDTRAMVLEILVPKRVNPSSLTVGIQDYHSPNRAEGLNGRRELLATL